jgi:TolB protein
VPLRPLAVGLVVAAALGLVGCGGSAKPRPDLIFVSTRSGVYDIYAMNADGKRQQRLTHGSETKAGSEQGLFYAVDPAWSHDGKSIAFTSTRTGSSSIFVMDSNGRNVAQLTRGAVDAHPTWSPDGSRIAFVRGKTGSLFVMSADGSGPHRITRGTAAEADPAWSPNGRWIAFVRSTVDTPVREVWLIHPNGTGAHMVTTLAHSVSGPAWSPDGRRIAFASNLHGNFGIYSIAVDGKGLRTVSATGMDSFSPSWSPDGKAIAFARNGSIVTVPVGPGVESVLTNGKDNDSSPVWNPIQARKSGGS